MSTNADKIFDDLFFVFLKSERGPAPLHFAYRLSSGLDQSLFPGYFIETCLFNTYVNINSPN